MAGPSRLAQVSLQLFEVVDMLLETAAGQLGDAEMLATGTHRQIVYLDGEQLFVPLEIGRDIGLVELGTAETVEFVELCLAGGINHGHRFVVQLLLAVRRRLMDEE